MNDTKHKDALRTIGEVASDVGVATHVLRFWENKFLQIKPQKRRGRRYYSVEDIANIKTIKALLYEQGYTIKGVHKFLKNIKKPEMHSNVDEFSSEFEKDLFGNIIISNKNNNKPIHEFGAIEMAKLKQIYIGLCSSRDKLKKHT